MSGFGETSLETAYQSKDHVQSSDNSEKEYYIKMSDDKNDLKSIKVYKFDNTKESWHEFALKFRVIADSRGYEEIIDGTKNPPDEREDLKYLKKLTRL